MKITKRQLRRIIREEKSRLAVEQKRRLTHDRNRQPLVEGFTEIKDGISAFMSLLSGNEQVFWDWLDANPKIKAKLESWNQKGASFEKMMRAREAEDKAKTEEG